MNANFKVESFGEWPDLDKFEEDLKNALVERVKLRTPVRTGTLRDSVQGEVVDDGINLGSDVDYVLPVEYGTINMSGHGMFRMAIEEMGTIASSIQVKMDKDNGTGSVSKAPSNGGKVSLSKK